jgi:hypothetical protein
MLVAPTDDGGVLSSLKRAGPTQRGFQQMVPHTKQWAEQDDAENNQRNQVCVKTMMMFFFFFWQISSYF